MDIENVFRGHSSIGKGLMLGDPDLRDLFRKILSICFKIILHCSQNGPN